VGAIPIMWERTEVVMSKKILVVDDEADVRRFLTAVLEKRGYETLTAADGREAYEIARRERPDLVILDLMMPNQSGTDFYRRLTKDKELSETPIIVVSGLAGRHLALKEPVAVFDKPIDPDEFGAAVDGALGVDVES
jgi:two-component system cell cycle response regulator DivK